MNFLCTKIGIYLFSEKINTIKFQNIPKTGRIKIVYFHFLVQMTADFLNFAVETAGLPLIL